VQRFALLGAGFIGSVHAANLAAHPDVDFALDYDVDQGRAGALADANGARPAADLAEAFDRDAVDAVFIASSTNTHAENLRLAADAGIAALCEKPIDLDLGRAVDVVRYAADRSARAMVNFNRRFDRDYAELKRVVDAGEIGQVELIQLTSRGPAMPPLPYIAVSGG
jgi:myo-inositol 2-dehydrogenase / D-chiro-inositol 1-dehydrogenase